MTVDEAISRPTTRPDLDKQVLESPFFKFWHRFDTQTCDAIAALIQQQQNILEQLTYILHDDYSESKDWKAGDVVERVRWLKIMFESKKDEVEQQQQQIDRAEKVCRAAEELDVAQDHLDGMLGHMCDTRFSAQKQKEVDFAVFAAISKVREAFAEWRGE